MPNLLQSAKEEGTLTLTSKALKQVDPSKLIFKAYETRTAHMSQGFVKGCKPFV